MFKTVANILVPVLLATIVTANFEANKIHLKDDLESRGLVEDIINQTITGIIADLPDVIVIPEVSLDLDLKNILTGHLDLPQLNITGLKGLEIPYLVTQGDVPLSLEIHLTLPLLDLNFLYSLDAVLLDLLPIYGDDVGSISIQNITINVTTDVKFSEAEIVQNLRILIGVGGINANIQGLLDNEEFSTIVNTLVNVLVPPLVNAFQEPISDLLSPIVQGVLNGLLSQSSGEKSKYLNVNKP